MKATCYRARANPDFFYQSYADFTEFCKREEYKYYIEDRKKETSCWSVVKKSIFHKTEKKVN
jgi:hypothetical protein